MAVLLALVAKCGAVALFVGGCPLGGLAAFVAVCTRLGVLASFHGVGLLWSGQFPLLHPVTVQALALSRGADRDNPAGDSVGLLCFGSVCPESDNLAAVGALAQCT